MMQSKKRNGQSLGVGVMVACALLLSSMAHAGVRTEIDSGVNDGAWSVMIDAPKAKPAAKPARKPAAKPAAKPARKPAARPAAKPSRRKAKPQRSTQPKRQAAPKRKATPTKRKAAPKRQAAPKKKVSPRRKPATQPKRTTKPKARPAPRPKQTTKPAARPARKPATRPVSKPTRPAAKPAAKPSVKPSAKPSAKPSPRPTNKPAARPTRQPSRQPVKTTTSRPTNKPTNQPANKPATKPANKPASTSNGLTRDSEFINFSDSSSSSKRAVPKGVQKQPVSVANGDRVGSKSKSKGKIRSANRPVIRPASTPIGFDIDKAKSVYLDRTGGTRGINGGGSMLDAGHSMQEKDMDGNHDNGHDDTHDGGHDDYKDGYGDGYHDGHDDGKDHHDGHHGDHYSYNFYTSNSYGCPNGWWYVYGDYDGDGYTDYVCTNGYSSVYWYGWSGSFWGSSPWYGWYGSYRSGYSWWYNSVSDRYRGSIYGQGGDLTPDPSYSSTPEYADEVPEAMPLSAIEVARLEMSIGNAEYAIEAYRSHLSEYPSDWLAVRELGLAKIVMGDRGDGIAMVSYAYSMDPMLGYEALPMSLFENDDRLIRDTVIDVVGWGHRNPSASAWLAVAVLMQAEGRDGPALRMIERAGEYGLDQDVDREMRLVLTHH